MLKEHLQSNELFINVSLQESYEAVFNSNLIFDALIIFGTQPLSTHINNLSKCHERFPAVKVLFIVGETQKRLLSRYMRLQINALLPEEFVLEELHNALAAIFKRTQKFVKYISPVLTPFTEGSENNSFTKLSVKELDVAMLTLAGNKNQEIAHQLCISPKTVSAHKTHIYQKLKVRNDVDLVKLLLAECKNPGHSTP